MNFWLSDYFKERKNLLISLYFFACTLLFGIIYFITQDAFPTNDSYYFYNDALVNAITIIDLVCLSIIFLLLVYKILFEFKLVRFVIPKVNQLILMVIGSFIVALLVWYEFYYVTLFYHGEVKSLSGYLIGSSIVFSIALTFLFSARFKSFTILFFIFAALSYFFYECQVVIIAKYVDVMNMAF